MLDDLKTFLRIKSPLEAFLTELKLNMEERARVSKAYKDIQHAFRGKFRESGEPFYLHPVAVSLIRVWSGEAYDADDIVASLHHDTVETFRTTWPLSYLRAQTNPTVAQLVQSITKMDVLLFEGDKPARDLVYFKQLAKLPRRNVLIKLADVLHNQMTLNAMPLEAQRRKLQEVQTFYLPLAHSFDFLKDELEFVAAENELSLQTGTEPE